ncbi:hypothetical protein C2S52_010960 [Perilla frutescens var. hirtella]|uniref:RRM domain-containing protein n=1 Tax=Perilla frutescens var. hirtella TaxID=608512 RepID=A0AAD4J246_PERFH|nr:hypothetical protein C2S52_010960 [Perilla frutescens var. hirtella]KAH6825749.1 hypothetical protein C2S53_006855 [Perilla frutescens var. hirtella]
MNKLSPFAPPYTPAAVVAQHHLDLVSEEKRSLYMTFSIGSPINVDEISNFFNSVYGHCVYHVYVHDEEKKDPRFGKVIFTTMAMPKYILRGRDVFKVFINNKPVWLKEYVARRLRRQLNYV